MYWANPRNTTLPSNPARSAEEHRSLADSTLHQSRQRRKAREERKGSGREGDGRRADMQSCRGGVQRRAPTTVPTSDDVPSSSCSAVSACPSSPVHHSDPLPAPAAMASCGAEARRTKEKRCSCSHIRGRWTACRADTKRRIAAQQGREEMSPRWKEGWVCLLVPLRAGRLRGDNRSRGRRGAEPRTHAGAPSRRASAATRTSALGAPPLTAQARWSPGRRRRQGVGRPAQPGPLRAHPSRDPKTAESRRGGCLVYMPVPVSVRALMKKEERTGSPNRK